MAPDEKPLAMFKDLHRAGKEPRFVLRRLHDSVNELERPTLQEPTNAFMDPTTPLNSIILFRLLHQLVAHAYPLQQQRRQRQQNHLTIWNEGIQ